MTETNNANLPALKFRITQISSIVPAESGGDFRFRNHYRCPSDGTEWADQWSCMCNDRCPVCGDEIEPYQSENI